MSQLAERYELGELLGSGGMARVFAAVDTRLQRRVAVKLIREEYVTDGTARARLLREARAAAAFQHPNAVAVFDVGEDAKGRPFIVMEPIEGETLADHLARFGPLTPADAAVVGTALLDALAAAHRRGLVHRDVKPANVLLPADSGVKLSDFGIAKGLDGATGGLTATGQIMGTPAYLSPEQAAGHPATARSDLYALGVVLYESLTGGPPFSGDTVRVAVAHQQEPVPPLAERAPATPPALAEAVERALAKDPDRRFADARQMRAALVRAGRQAGSPSSVTAPVATVAASDTRHPGATAETGPIAAAGGSAPGRGVRSRHSLAAIAVVGGVAVLALLSLLLWRGVWGLDVVRPDEPGDPLETSTMRGTTTRTSPPPCSWTRAAGCAMMSRSAACSPTDVAARAPGWDERAGDLADDLSELLHEDDTGDGAEHAARLIADLRKRRQDGEMGQQRGQGA